MAYVAMAGAFATSITPSSLLVIVVLLAVVSLVTGVAGCLVSLVQRPSPIAFEGLIVCFISAAYLSTPLGFMYMSRIRA